MTVAKHNDKSAGLRAPELVMRLKRMGSFHQSRLSFMRVLLRRLKREKWQFDRPRFDLDKNGVGVACYRAIGPKRTYTLVAFSHDLPDEKRSDRVIADAWDATFALVDGEASDADIERLSRNVPLQEAGRVSDREFVLSRANRSVRLFNHVRECLANGKQPEAAQLDAVGYLMRTTAVYGSGKFGAADRSNWAERDEFSGSFQPEMLSVWLIRAFTVDVVEHLARCDAPDQAVSLDPDIRRRLGVGNSTGLGMAPFLINHPALLSAWIGAREEALARVCAIESADDRQIERFRELVCRAGKNALEWQTEHPYQLEKINGLKADFEQIGEVLAAGILSRPFPWRTLYEWGEEALSLEGQEQLVSLMLEPHGDLVDGLASCMSADESRLSRIEGRDLLGNLKSQIEQHYAWVFDVDYADKAANARVWYVSEEKLEPRLGERFEEPLEPYEQPLQPGRDVRQLHEAIEAEDGAETVASFLMKHPRFRHAVRRVQLTARLPYGEIHDNTIASEMMPIDLLRCKLSFFGATKFDPRSDRWVRITMYQGAPFPDELYVLDPDDLAYPQLPS